MTCVECGAVADEEMRASYRADLTAERRTRTPVQRTCPLSCTTARTALHGSSTRRANRLWPAVALRPGTDEGGAGGVGESDRAGHGRDVAWRGRSVVELA